MDCQHEWVPFPFDSTRFWCYRCRGKTTAQTLCTIEEKEREGERWETVELFHLEYA